MADGGDVPPPRESGPGLVRASDPGTRLSTLHPLDREARLRCAQAFDAYLRREHIANTDAARAMHIKSEHAIRDMRAGLRPIPFHKLSGFAPHHEHALRALLGEAARAAYRAA
jgi:hypothetical protein